jgi:TPR repeat protein
LPRSYYALIAAAGFAVLLLAGIGIFISQSEPLPPSQEALDADFAKGDQYQHGTGVTLDYGQALAWYHKAAAGGHPRAEFQIGRMTEAGQGVVRDDKVAYDWFLRAAEHGLPDAQVYLAKQLMGGIGTPDGKPNMIEALKWLLLGPDTMPDSPIRQVVIDSRDKLSQMLSPEDRAEAERRANEWRDAHAAPR